MHGCNGRMGQMITGIVKEYEDAEIVAGIDVADNITTNGYPVFTDIDACDVEADVVIDFSSATAVDKLMDYCEKRNLPVVLCSTGLSEEQMSRVKALSEKIPVLKSANMSLGINLLQKLLKEAAAILAPSGFDIEVVEVRDTTPEELAQLESGCGGCGGGGCGGCGGEGCGNCNN